MDQRFSGTQKNSQSLSKLFAEYQGHEQVLFASGLCQPAAGSVAAQCPSLDRGLEAKRMGSSTKAISIRLVAAKKQDFLA